MITSSVIDSIGQPRSHTLCLYCTNRLIDLVKLKATNLQRVTYLVFDEADRMFDMGFGEEGRAGCEGREACEGVMIGCEGGRPVRV